MPFHDELLACTQVEREALLSIPLIRDALAGEVTRAQYLAFLTQAYHHVKHTVPLLMSCGARLPQRLDWVRAAVVEYIDEEAGHEDWILADITAAGGDAAAARAAGPSFAPVMLGAYAYHPNARGNPLGFLGLVVVLEATSTALAIRAAEVLQQRLQLPHSAFTYLTSHGTLDQEHMRFFAGLMNRLEDADDQAAVVHVARRMYRLYGDVFRGLPQGEAQ